MLQNRFPNIVIHAESHKSKREINEIVGFMKRFYSANVYLVGKVSKAGLDFTNIESPEIEDLLSMYCFISESDLLITDATPVWEFFPHLDGQVYALARVEGSKIETAGDGIVSQQPFSRSIREVNDMNTRRVFVFFILMLAMTASLVATESEDLQFIVKLYANGEYRIAQLEIDKFLKSYPDSRFIPDVTYLKADIMLRKRVV